MLLIMKKIIYQFNYKNWITIRCLFKLFLLNATSKPFNKISLIDFFDIDDVIKNSETENIITKSVQILSILLNEDEDRIRLFKVNKISISLLNYWLLILFRPVHYKTMDHSNSTFGNFIDNEQLLSMGRRYDAMKIICERNKININKAQDCIEYYQSYIIYTTQIKEKFKGIFINEDDEDIEVDSEIKTFESEQNKIKDKQNSNWIWYSIIDKISNNDITKHDEILLMSPEKIFTNLAYKQFNN